MRVEHSIPPVYDKNSKILILGSLPSVLSRKEGFFYGNVHNRFWRVLALVLNVPLPQTTQEKKHMLISNHIALWDVIKSCDITGSADSSIKNAIPNDVDIIYNSSKINAVFANGNTAYKLCKKLLNSQREVDIIPMPSTSPANASCSLEELVSKWKIIKTYLKD